MQLTPRYDGPAVLRIEVPVGDVSVPLLRQRRRLAAVLAGLDDGQWASPSRCSAWSVRDVVSHLVDTDRFWALSIKAGRAGAPTRFLSGFDPAVTPELLVEPRRASAPGAVLDAFVEALDELDQALSDLDAPSWELVAEAPPGHVALPAVVLHALWDGWVHERDIVLRLGGAPAEEDDEVLDCLAYAVALGPAFLASGGSTRAGTLVVESDWPIGCFAVDTGATVVVRPVGAADAGAPTLRGPGVELVEGLSLRAPLAHGLGAADVWLLGGLDEVFDQEARSAPATS